MAGRQDTKLESEGAEFLVCGHLLIEAIPSYKTYTQMPGYDIIATNPELGFNARIQVKSRWATDGDGGFLIKNFNADFVVLALLNRGYRFTKKNADPSSGKLSPAFYILPIEVVRLAQNKKSKLGKVLLRKIEKSEQYRDAWHLIGQFLKKKRVNKTVN